MSTSAMRRAVVDLENAIPHIMSTLAIPSVSAAIVYDQDIVWSGGYGVPVFNTSLGKSPTLDTVYRTGSIGKLYTTLLMMVARDKGLLHLDTPVASLIPDYRWLNPFEDSSRGPTFQQVASHMAGIPREAFLRLDGPPTNRKLFPHFANLSLAVPPDSLPLYSNLAFACLGNIVAQLLNMSYADVLESLVLGPLQLLSTSVAYASRFHGRMAEGWDFGVLLPADEALFDLTYSTPAGGHFTSVRDLASLLSFFFRQQARAGANQVIEGASIRQMFLPRYVTRDHRAGFATPFELVWTEDDLLLHTKRGDQAGYSAEVLMSASLKVGLVVMVNSIELGYPVAQLISNIIRSTVPCS